MERKPAEFPIHLYVSIPQLRFLVIGECTVPVQEFPGCTLLGETPQQISANNILAFACGNSSNVTAFGTTLMRCRENGTWEEVILDNRGLWFSCIKHRLLVCIIYYYNFENFCMNEWTVDWWASH